MLQLSMMSAAGTSLQVRAARGHVSLPSAAFDMNWDAPANARLAPLLRVAAAIMMPSSAVRMKTVVRINRQIAAFLVWADVPAEQITGDILIAYAVARCCPPIGTELPTGWADKPVLPSTVKTELGALRSAAKLGIAGAGPMLDAVMAPRLSIFLKSVGANVGRLKSNKKPLLWSSVTSFVEPILERARRADTYTASIMSDVRDAFALTLCFCTGARCAELLALRGADLVIEDDAGVYVQATFRQTKTRRTALGTHDPFVSVATNTMLLELFEFFDQVCGWEADGPVWTSYRHGEEGKPLSRDWFARVVAKADPGCSPHSCRVGMATDLWAAGCTMEEIMAAGRWTSAAAVLYVIGALDHQLVIADALGTGGLSYDGDKLRKRGIRAGVATKPAAEQVRQWMALCVEQ